MNKEEILAKSREDNRGADERFRILNQRQSVVMVGAMLAMWLLLFLWNVFRGLDTSQGGAIMLRRGRYGLLAVLPVQHEVQFRLRPLGRVRAGMFANQVTLLGTM